MSDKTYKTCFIDSGPARYSVCDVGTLRADVWAAFHTLKVLGESTFDPLCKKKSANILAKVLIVALKSAPSGMV